MSDFKNNLLVSIYIPTSNRLSLLRRSVKSVLNQTYKNIELIIVNDNSTDGTRDFLREISCRNKRIKVVNFDKSFGACFARNEAILRSKGYFVTGLDDDDYYSNEKVIENFINCWFENHHIEKKILFDNIQVKTRFGLIKRKKSNFISSNDLRLSNCVGSQIFGLRLTFIEAGLFDPLMPVWQDWDLNFRINQLGYSFLNIQKFSYVIDKSHNFNRISLVEGRLIEIAMNNLVSKICNCTEEEKIKVLTIALSYKNFNLTTQYFFYLLKNFEFYFLFKYPILKFFNYLGFGK